MLKVSNGLKINEKIKIDRWDSPLFEIRENEATPLKEIAQVILFEEKKAKDPISTKSVYFFFAFQKKIFKQGDKISNKFHF